MPRQPPTPCTADPRCPNLVDRPGPCPDHRRERQAAHRDNHPWRDYSSARWQAARARQLARHPLCVSCGTPATLVDHITPLRHGGTHAPENLQSMCWPCHSAKTAAENGFGGNPLAGKYP